MMTQQRFPSGSPVPVLVVVLEGACLGLLGILFAIGAFMAAAVGPAWLAALHVRAADLLVVLSVGLLVVGYAVGVHRMSGLRWLAHCALLLAVLAMYVVGDAAVRDPDGAAGREHIGAVLGATPGPALTLVAHLAGGLALVAGALFALVKWRRASHGAGRVRAQGAAWSVVVAGIAALAFPVAPRAPMLSVETVPVPPWPALAIVPLEARIPLTAALLLVAVVAAWLALVPLVDRASRPPWVRRFTTSTLVLLLLTFLALMIIGAVVPEPEHVL